MQGLVKSYCRQLCCCTVHTLSSLLQFPLKTIFTVQHWSSACVCKSYFVLCQVPLPPIDERKKVIEDLDKDRRYAVDAAIVRTMKSRKVLQHQQLTMEVVQQLSRMFKADFKLIKKRIEDLMSRDYLERDKDNPNLLRYLA